MSGQEIAFGTDGWRAVIAEGFTFDNVRRVSEAMAVAARTFQPPPDIDRNTIAVGYDRRFLSAEFAAVVAETFSRAGFQVLLSNQAVPSQTVSFTAHHRKIIGGVVVTASHNPARYNGLKFKAWYGGSALSEMYERISSSLGQSTAREGGSVTEEFFLADYVTALREQLDVKKIREGNLAILHDPIHGVAAQIPSHVLGMDYVGNARIIRPRTEEHRHTIVDTIRGEINPSFGGANPEPIPENLLAAQNVMINRSYDLAICNDGDADRLGILDERGEFVSPHKVLSLLALYLGLEKRRKGDIVKTFSTTRMIERVAESLNATWHETAIGFKWIADLMLKGDVMIGGEESGGIGFGHFLPERDGILSGLMVAEVVAHYRQPLSKLVAGLEREFGTLYYDRRDLHRPMEACTRLIERVRNGELDSAFGLDFASREEKDGVKINFDDGSWILFRKSGTEPMLRIYAECPDREHVKRMLDIAESELDRS